MIKDFQYRCFFFTVGYMNLFWIQQLFNSYEILSDNQKNEKINHVLTIMTTALILILFIGKYLSRKIKIYNALLITHFITLISFILTFLLAMSQAEEQVKFYTMSITLFIMEFSISFYQLKILGLTGQLGQQETVDYFFGNNISSIIICVFNYLCDIILNFILKYFDYKFDINIVKVYSSFFYIFILTIIFLVILQKFKSRYYDILNNDNQRESLLTISHNLLGNQKQKNHITIKDVYDIFLKLCILFIVSMITDNFLIHNLEKITQQDNKIFTRGFYYLIIIIMQTFGSYCPPKILYKLKKIGDFLFVFRILSFLYFFAISYLSNQQIYTHIVIRITIICLNGFISGLLSNQYFILLFQRFEEKEHQKAANEYGTQALYLGIFLGCLINSIQSH